MNTSHLKRPLITSIISIVEAVFLLFFFVTASHAYPSVLSESSGVISWSVYDTLIWRFPESAKKEVYDMSARFNALIKKGFAISDLRVAKGKNIFSLMINDTTLLTASREHARGSGTEPRTIALTWLSRLYDAIGSSKADQLTDKHKLRGKYELDSKVSWYGGKFLGRKCANGEILTDTHLCAAAKSLPFGTLVRITVPSTKRSVVIRITDRFAEHKGRALDVSTAAADILGIKKAGVANVNIQVIGRVGKVAE